MKKSKLLGTLLCTVCMAAGTIVPTIPAMADGTKVVTLGADLSDAQKNTMLQYFNVSADQVQILYITNQDERNHLSSYVPLEQIGTRTVSCAYVKPTTSGGIKVRTANLNWVTCNMIASSLSTSGVTNCEVVAACPFEVSGTGALTGVQMAYEAATGTTLDETKKNLATEEMVVTGNLADQVGTDEATSVINQSKMEVLSGNVQDADQINNIIVNVAGDVGVTLSEDEVSTITDLLSQIAQQDYDYSAMEETLTRVEENANGETSTDTSSDSSEDGDSIVTGLDDSILGTDVLASSTEDPTLASDTGLSTDGAGDTIDMVETEEGAETATSEGDALVVEGDTTTTGDAAAENVGGADETTEADGDEESLDITEMDTSYLDEESQSKFDKAMTFCKAEYLNDADSLDEILLDWNLTPTVTDLDEELGNQLLNAVMKDYLGILGNGTGAYEPDGTEKYLTAELNMLDKDLQKIFGIDLTDEEKTEEGADLLGDSYTEEEKTTIYQETMIFFEKLYGESYYSETNAVAETASAETTSYADETTGDELYEETTGEDDMILE